MLQALTALTSANGHRAADNAPYVGRLSCFAGIARFAGFARFAGIALMGSVLGTATPLHASELDIGTMAPNFTLKSTQGDNLRLGEFAGDVRALLFTASWCGNCVDALRALQTLTPQMQSYGFQAWAINLDDDPTKTRDTAQQLSLGYPMLIDTEGRVAKMYWIDDLPALFLLDRDGCIRLVLEGDEVKNTASVADTLKRIAEE